MPADQPKTDYLLKQLSSLLPSSVHSAPLAGRAVDVIVTPVEVNDRHGTGVFLQMLFAADEDIISIRSLDQHGGKQSFGLPMKIVHGGSSRDAVFSRVESALRGVAVRRVLCVPYFPNDILTAIAVHGIFGAPMCSFIMDDQNVAMRGIPDELMGELLDKSALRLAISPEMLNAYARKFGVPFYYTPPMAPAAHAAVVVCTCRLRHPTRGTAS